MSSAVDLYQTFPPACPRFVAQQAVDEDTLAGAADAAVRSHALMVVVHLEEAHKSLFSSECCVQYGSCPRLMVAIGFPGPLLALAFDSMLDDVWVKVVELRDGPGSGSY